jgi:DNA-directed RNA polymerase subunit M/transcription elongation factor TFIIS
VARDWSKQARRTAGLRAVAEEAAARAALIGDEPEERPSKADLRAEIEALTNGCRVRRLPTRVDLKCGKCGHAGRALVRDNQRGQPFKCTRCGNSQRLP